MTTSKTRVRLIVTVLLAIIVVIIPIGGFQLITRNVVKENMLGKRAQCNLPCWNRITPGLTTDKEAIQILQDTPYIDKESIKISGSNASGGCIWHWIVSGRRLPPSIRWENGVVREVSFGLPYYLTVEDVLEMFGSPEAVFVKEGGIPENWYWIVDMVYPKLGIQVKVYTADFSTYIEPTTEAGAFILFSPTSLDNRLTQLYPGLSSNSMDWLFKTWKGFGDVKMLYEIK